jgi:MOSC domain-containing protein YiiM
MRVVSIAVSEKKGGGIDWETIPVGDRCEIGESAVVEITQIGKECHNRCAICPQAGECIMSHEGIFARVLRRGKIRRGDSLCVLHGRDDSKGTMS